jgi:hypothetical protein
VWDEVERAISESYARGKAAATAFIDRAVAAAEAAFDDLGDKAVLLQTALLDKVRCALQSVIDQALAMVRSDITIGGRAFELSGADIEQKVSFGGSLKGSILAACELAAEGALTISAHYGLRA